MSAGIEDQPPPSGSRSFAAALEASAWRLIPTNAEENLATIASELGRLAHAEGLRPEQAVVAFRRVWEREVADVLQLSGRSAAETARHRAIAALLDGYFGGEQ